MNVRERLEAIDVEAAQKAAQRFVDDFFDNAGRERPRVSIPARETDDDIVLTEAVKMVGLLKRALLAAIEQRNHELSMRQVAAGGTHDGRIVSMNRDKLDARLLAILEGRES